MSNPVNETRNFVQGKLAEFCKKVSRGQTRPVQKFYYDVLMGLCGTGSPSLHNIAKMLMDKVSTKKTSERLYRNMRREGLAEEIDRTLMELIRPQVTKDTLFIVDESDIEKPYAKKMEGCQLVHNGSKGKNTNGYLLLNIMAMLPQEEGYKLLPASSILFSSSMEIDSRKQVLQDKIVDQEVAFCGKGTYVFDRGYDDRKLIGFLVDNGVSFVIRGMGTRAVKEGIPEINFKEIVNKMDFRHEFPGNRKLESFKCATRRIGVRTEDHYRKYANSVEVSLVVVRRYQNGTRKGKDFYLLCDFDDPNMTETEIITKAMDTYRKRWSIEEVHRQMKQSMKWEGMRLASYQGITSMLSWLCHCTSSTSAKITSTSWRLASLNCYST